jgi:hypothetical protein
MTTADGIQLGLAAFTQAVHMEDDASGIRQEPIIGPAE